MAESLLNTQHVKDLLNKAAGLDEPGGNEVGQHPRGGVGLPVVGTLGRGLEGGGWGFGFHVDQPHHALKSQGSRMSRGAFARP